MLRGKALLTPIQRAFLQLFADLPDREQVHLAGGTALAESDLILHRCHCRSL